LPIENRILQVATVLVVLLGLTGGASARTIKSKAKHGHVASAHHHSSRHHSPKHASTTAFRSHGQQTIDPGRATAIQDALIRSHYLSGEPTGAWDQASKDAMLRYQANNGWQTKVVPDSRALIKLGLGPDHKGLLNPETANIPSPAELGVDNEAQSIGAADNQ
jgi:hypothetical protein